MLVFTCRKSQGADWSRELTFDDSDQVNVNEFRAEISSQLSSLQCELLTLSPVDVVRGGSSLFYQTSQHFETDPVPVFAVASAGFVCSLQLSDLSQQTTFLDPSPPCSARSSFKTRTSAPKTALKNRLFSDNQNTILFKRVRYIFSPKSYSIFLFKLLMTDRL